MANNVSNYLQIVGTDAVQDAMDDLFENAGGYAETTQFVNTFYGTDIEGGVQHTWLYDNVGAKWIYVENCIDNGSWNIQSANHTPKEFWIHLYKLAVKIDPDVKVEVKYQDESYNPVGGFVVKKDHNGTPAWAESEEYDVEDPTVDMNWEDDGYDDAQQEFNEMLDDMQTGHINYAHDTVHSGEGTKIEL